MGKMVPWLLLALAAWLALVGDRTAWGQGCRWMIVAYQHPYDVASVQSCNFFGCSSVPQQIPCQHPVWQCR